jgi:hypothetical protein
MSPWWMKPTQENRRDSGKLIILSCLLTIAAILNLVVGLLKFSDGKVWFGALYSVVALLLGILAVKGFMGWRRWRAERSESTA